MSVILNTLTDIRLIEFLKNGGVGVLPTDTLYGLVCSAADPVAVKRLYAIKKRENKPGTVIAANTDQLVALGLKPRYLKAVERFWPGPISIVVPNEPGLSYLDLGKMSLAVRIPKDPETQALLEQSGPLLTTSANLAAQPLSDTLQEAREYFQDEVDFYVDGGDLSNRKPSTLIRVVDDAIEVLRPGAVEINEETGEVL